MALKHAILALLEHQPLTGYEIKDAFDGPLELMWSASFGGLYPALHKMKLEKLVDETFIVQHDKPNKKVYEITEKGRVVLQQWMQRPPLPESVKDEFLLKMYLMPDSDPFAAETLLIERKHRSEKKIEYFSSEAKAKKQGSFFLDYSLHRYTSELRWITDALKLLKAKNKRAIQT